MNTADTQTDYIAQLKEAQAAAGNTHLNRDVQLNRAKAYERAIRLLISNNIEIVKQSLTTVLNNRSHYAQQVVGVANKITQELNAKGPVI